jgi:hypothetical protein
VFIIHKKFAKLNQKSLSKAPPHTPAAAAAAALEEKLSKPLFFRFVLCVFILRLLSSSYSFSSLDMINKKESNKK